MIRRTLDDHIEVTPDICSGQPRIRGHRITVRQIVTWHDRMGQSADEIATEHDVSVADVYAALAYYFDNREAIDQAATSADTIMKDIQANTTSKLKQKLSDGS